MLAGALRAYANRWGAKAGERIAVFTNNDDGLRTAIDLQAKGVDIVAVIDSREGGELIPGVRHLRGAEVIDSSGKLNLKSITVRQDERKFGNHCGGRAWRLGWLESECEHPFPSSVTPGLR
jgi:hypothetical protein